MPTQEQVYKALHETESVILAHLDELSRAGTPSFDEWLVCSQALMQLHQTYLLQGMSETLNTLQEVLDSWQENGVPVRSINPFSEL